MNNMTLEPPPILDPRICLELDDGRIFTINGVPEPPRHELVKRWNAFDELHLQLQRCAALLHPDLQEYKDAQVLLAKYDVRSTES